MPVRIYDIAKKLGSENKEVLSKAKELGIAAARVPSSSLDKITAEYLESHLKPATPALPETPPATPTAPEPIVIVSAPPEEAPIAQAAGPAHRRTGRTHPASCQTGSPAGRQRGTAQAAPSRSHSDPWRAAGLRARPDRSTFLARVAILSDQTASAGSP